MKEILVIRLFQNMAIAVSSQNVNITVYNFGENYYVLKPENIIDDLKLLKRNFRNRTILDSFRDIFVLSKLIRTVKPEIIHVNALQDLATAFIARRLSSLKGHKPPIIGMSHNPLSWVDTKTSRRNAKFIKLFSDGFIALSTTHKNQLLKLGIPKDKISVIPNPYDPIQLKNDFSTYNNISDGIIRIVYIANICERKAQDVLIHAALSVLSKYPDVQFDLIGKVLVGEEEYTENLKSLIKKNNINESVHLVGEVPYNDVLNRLNTSDIFVFPTLAEMMPRAVIEAMVIGKPVIASDVDGIKDLIQNKKTGVLVQPGNVADLASAICELIENPGKAKTLGLAGKEFVLDFCSPENVGRQFIYFYEYILKNDMKQTGLKNETRI